MAKPDYAHKMTDAELSKLEQRIAKLYKEVAYELTDTVKTYFEQFEKRDAAMKKKLDAGEITEQQYKQWRLAQMGRGKRFTALRDKVAERYTNANETAVAYVNDATPGIYSLNRNYSAYKIEQVSDKADFTLWDEQTVKRLIAEQPDLMPYYPPKRALQRGIDLKYGKQQITASVTSSILQGKGIGKISDDLQSRMQVMNRTSAIRTARTAVTGAQNAGRLDTYRAAQDMGIKLKKRWLATLDNRTRHAHAMLDGQTVDVDKPFKVDGCELKAQGDGGYKTKYEAEHKAFVEYKANVDAEKTTDAKEKALSDVLLKIGISEKRISSVARLAKGDGLLDKLELDDKGAIKDVTTLEKSLKTDYGEYITKSSTKGADTSTPPANNGGKALTREDIYKTDDKGRYVLSTSERQAALVNLMQNESDD